MLLNNNPPRVWNTRTETGPARRPGKAEQERAGGWGNGEAGRRTARAMPVEAVFSEVDTCPARCLCQLLIVGGVMWFS